MSTRGVPKHLSLYEYDPAAFAERFWRRVVIGEADECWAWRGAKKRSKGYGYAWFEHRTQHAHRVAYVLTHGPLPADTEACHDCDRRDCCNPAHIRPDTHDANVRDIDLRGRRPHLIGDRNPNCKLRPHDVDAIRRRHSAGEAKRALATAFAVTPANVRRIVRGETWSHLS